MSEIFSHPQLVNPWYAVRIQSKLGPLASLTLRDRGYEEFLPLYSVRRRWSDRIKQLEVPLFPGYLFCRFDVTHRLPVLSTPGVIGIVGFGKIPVPIHDCEIEAIRRVLQSGIPAEPWKYIPSGQRVRVEQGPLAGLEGVFLEQKSDYRLLLSIEVLQRSVAVQIDAACVRPVRTACPVPAPALTFANQ